MFEVESSQARSYVRVVPEVALDRCFDYTIPETMVGKIEMGHRLRVPWGRKTTLGYAVAFPENPEVEKCRDVLEVIGSEPLISSSLVKLARWLADYYCCDFPLALRGVLPGTIRQKEDASRKQLWVSVPSHFEDSEVLNALGKAKAQKKIWIEARKRGGAWKAELIRDTATSPAAVNALVDKGYLRLSKEKMERDPLTGEISQSTPLLLTEEQKIALQCILKEITKGAEEKSQPILLQGVTGSGKTEIYLQVLDEVLKKGNTALVLVPEIALTGQTVDRFRARFEGQSVRLAVLHSHLSAGERYDQWKMIHEGRARIVIGARSAVFAPLQNLGVIIVDEEHESSYKQEEAPHYHARDVAVVRGAMQNVAVVLGSATPSLESVHNAQSGKYILSKLTQRVEKLQLPTIHVLDLRRDKKLQHKNASGVVLAERLRDAVLERLEKKQQSILFLNRRGYATSLQCPNCGHVQECPHCAVPLTYHRTTNLLRCHFCDHQEQIPQRCPECEHFQYKYAGVGTQRIEDAVEAFFPEATLQRMDSDSMRGKNAYDQALGNFRSGKTDILLGTQMISKGLHFPNVTCVGVINCDSALQLPDFRAAERVFQQLVQVAGRAGRGSTPGEVFIQSYTPFHPAIQFARHHDVEGFQDQELEFRKAEWYPPYARAVLVTFRGKSENKTEYCIRQAAKKVRARISHASSKTDVPEPGPAPLAKLRDEFRYHLFIRTNAILKLSRILNEEIRGVAWPDGIKASVNVDPLNLL
ncbi:MAG: primosomal protein N' [Verrucomicrobiota bacterium]